MQNYRYNQIDNELLTELKDDCQIAYASLFDKYYKNLVLYAGTIIREQMICEDIVQNVLLRLWQDRKTLKIEISLKAFLIRSVRNSCIDEIRHHKIVDDYATKALELVQYDDALDYVLYSDLEVRLTKAIDNLPEKCREAFLMSRSEDLKYKEIAERLNVSQRTVEDRISKALTQLRIELKDFLMLILILLSWFKL